MPQRHWRCRHEEWVLQFMPIFFNALAVGYNGSVLGASSPEYRDRCTVFFRTAALEEAVRFAGRGFFSN